MHATKPEVLDTVTNKKFTKKVNDRITLTMLRTVYKTGEKVTRTNYQFGSSCHWSPDIAVLEYRIWNDKVTDYINWSGGGCNNGFSVEEYALAQAGIFKWMTQIARKHGGKVTP
jgi:hypothetical protein